MDKEADHKAQFNDWWVQQNFGETYSGFPAEGRSVFSYYVDSQGGDFGQFRQWKCKQQAPTQLTSSCGAPPFQAQIVEETTSLSHLFGLLLKRKCRVLLVGSNGSGKTTMMRSYLSTTKGSITHYGVVLNSWTTPQSLASTLSELSGSKGSTPAVSHDKLGGEFGGLQISFSQPAKIASRSSDPSALKHAVYFLDDLNMPQICKYGGNKVHSLLRSHFEGTETMEIVPNRVIGYRYSHSLPRSGVFVAAMTPSDGHAVDRRLLRHFSTFSYGPLTVESLETIFGGKMAAHYASSSSSMEVTRAAVSLHALLELGQQLSGVNFHYQFNLRQLARVFDGLLRTDTPVYDLLSQPSELAALFVHEARRVYRDKFTTVPEQQQFDTLLANCCAEHLAADVSGSQRLTAILEPEREHTLARQPLIFTRVGVGQQYCPISSWQELRELLQWTQAAHRPTAEHSAPQQGLGQLVFFEAALEHVSRILRALSTGSGHALLVGVSGSGKRSLAKLAALTLGLKVHNVADVNEFRSAVYAASLADATTVLTAPRGVACIVGRAGGGSEGEDLLRHVGATLQGDDLSSLFAPGATDNERGPIVQLRARAEEMGGWKTFSAHVRRHLHVLICASPVGPTFQSYCKLCPAILRHTTMDWFHEWPRSALLEIALAKLHGVENMEGAPQWTLGNGPHRRTASFLSHVFTSWSVCMRA